MRGILLVALAGLAALMAGAGASDGKVVIPGAEGEIRPVGQPGFVHEGRLYGVIPRREGNRGEITYRVNVKRSPQPRVEHILNRDVAIKWEAEGKLAIDGIGKRTQDADELLATATFKAERESQWGKAHDVRCVLSWPVAGGGGSSSQRSGMTLTGHIVAPEVKLKELSFNHRPGENASDAIDLVANAGDTAPAAVVPEYVSGREGNYPVAYIPGVKPSVKAVFAVRPGFIPSLTVSSPAPVAGNPGNSYQILEGLPEVAAERGAGGQTPSGDAATFTALLQDGRETPRVIGNHTVALRWRVESMANVKFTGGYWEYLAETTQNNVYTLLDAPKMPWNDGGGGEGSYPWFGALEFVIGPAKNGKTCGTDGIADAHEAMRKITEYLFYEHKCQYDTDRGKWRYGCAVNYLESFRFNGYIRLSKGHTVNCYDQAGALYVSSRLVGINSDFYFMEPFGMIKPTYLVGYDKKCNNPFFRNFKDGINSPESYMEPYVKDEKIVRTGFGNHAFVVYDALVYDACARPVIGKSKSQYFNVTIDVKYHSAHPDALCGDLMTLERSKCTEIPELIHD